MALSVSSLHAYVILLLILAMVLVLDMPTVESSPNRLKRQSILFEEKRPFQISDCRDYASRPGLCGPIRRCPSLLALLTRPSQSNVQKIRSSICGFQQSGSGKVPKLCCALDDENGGTSGELVSTESPETTPTPAETTRPSSTQNPSFHNHPNAHLVPRAPKCGTDTNTRIVGGKEAFPDEYPWLCVIAYRVTGVEELDVNCGCALINKQYVVTAAHCVTKLPRQYKLEAIRLGEYRLDSDDDCVVEKDGRVQCSVMEEFRPQKIIPHPQYDKPERFHNDIALLRLDRPTRRLPICLPFSTLTDRDLNRRPMIVAGFGVTEPFGESSNILLDLRVPYVNNTYCREVFARHRSVVGPNQLCAGGDQGRDSCGGDSGGPLMYISQSGIPIILAGVVSYGVTKCGTERIPGVYTRTDRYMDFILDNIEK